MKERKKRKRINFRNKLIEEKGRGGIEWRKTRTRMRKKILVGTLKILFSLFPFERRRFRFPSLRCNGSWDR